MWLAALTGIVGAISGLTWIIHEARRCGLEAGLPAMIAASTARARRTVAA
jgi:hypothetical protein